jgi:chaperone required for assembly of F1-ATPase
MKWPVALNAGAKNESFKKPAGVREMPFGWTGVRHRLNDGVLRREGRREQLGEVPNLLITIREPLGLASFRVFFP